MNRPETTMTDERLALLELIENGAGADLVRELLAFAAERMMAMEVDALTGAVDGPLVGLLQEDRADETGDRGLVGKDPDDIGAPLISPFRRSSGFTERILVR
jgi:hypothetical protein